MWPRSFTTQGRVIIAYFIDFCVTKQATCWTMFSFCCLWLQRRVRKAVFIMMMSFSTTHLHIKLSTAPFASDWSFCLLFPVFSADTNRSWLYSHKTTTVRLWIQHKLRTAWSVAMNMCHVGNCFKRQLQVLMRSLLYIICLFLHNKPCESRRVRDRYGWVIVMVGIDALRL
jgi:hypothetical protein